MAGEPSELPDVPTLLAAAVAGIAGAERPGQVKMAEAVARAMDGGEHLAVQAGTGTGKSMAYLVPAARHAARPSWLTCLSRRMTSWSSPSYGPRRRTRSK